MAIIAEINGYDTCDGNPLPEHPVRKAWREAGVELAKAQTALPACNERPAGPPRAQCPRILPRRRPLMRPCRSGDSSRRPLPVVPTLLLWLKTFLLLSPAAGLLW